MDGGFTDEQLRQLQQNGEDITQREQEITKIAESIQELASIFNDLAQLVVEQGTILDRIDYNLEMTEQRVEEGLVELERGQKYQKKSTKKIMIIGLILLIVCVLIGGSVAGKF